MICALRGIGDPLLGAIDDPLFAIFGQNCCGLKTHDITASRRFRYRKADKLLTSQDIRYDPGLKFWGTKVEDWREADDLAAK